jgi:hypothetical protein
MMRLMAISIAAVVLTMTPTLGAHEGHAHKTMGVVSMIHENHLEVTDLKEQKKTFALDTSTKITRGKTPLRAEEIKVGERVVVTYQQVKGKDGKVTEVVKTVQVETSVATKAGA